MSKNVLQEISLFATDLAIKAGELIKHEREQNTLTQTYKSNHELVTQADIKADELITRQIREVYPDHRILSEESSPDSLEQNSGQLDSPIWIIDPIDGTVNYAHGHHQVAISIAYADAGKVQVGIVHCPFQGETFEAVRGQDSLMNGNPIAVSHKRELRKALIGTGFPYDKSNLEPLIKRLRLIVNNCQDIRRIGSAAIDICWVAMGRLDGFYESLSPWDFAAAQLIAEQAGARCGHFSPIPLTASKGLYGEDILIATPELYDELAHLLRSATDRAG
ncbi:inositol monophosphatase family protein [Alkalimarinus coralli]|uniref:inositol monophosphatase family protein n=1 Tax=Alkalimarinus coralli TaxID=2935863 RepID=UPI00202B7EA2|nr:inositol monophosphatase family protein [Alkalimarinus coralli]